MIGDKEKSPFRPKSTRRRFLKGAAIAAGALAGAFIRIDKNTPQPVREQALPQIEQLKTLQNDIVVIDFAPHKPQEGVNQLEEGSQDFINVPDLPFDVKESIQKEVASHGENVARVMQRVWRSLGYEGSINLFPLQNTFRQKDVETQEDELGNKVYLLTIDQDKLSGVLERYPDQKVVNLSLQLGKVGFTILEREKRITKPVDYPTQVAIDGQVKYLSSDGRRLPIASLDEYEAYRQKLEEEATEVVKLPNPYPALKEAYTKEEARKNLSRLFALCEKYPEKLFIAAAGNTSQDLRELGDRPTNLLLVAEWDHELERPKNNILGADIYVDNRAQGFDSGSSFSTPVISALCSILLNRGLGIQGTKNELLWLSDIKNYDIEGKKEYSKVLNIDRLTRQTN